MALAQAFFSQRAPLVDEAALTCVGVRLDGDAADWIAAATPFVTPGEVAQARRFAQAKDAARHLAGRALVRRVLAAALGRPFRAEFARAPWGKPVCPQNVLSGEGGLDFSISHSGDMVWTAFCRAGSVGIDVERTTPLPDLFELAEQLHPRECEAIRSLPTAERTSAFYRCWTRKEAVLKALGRGLNQPLQSFQVRPEPLAQGWLVALPSVPSRSHSPLCLAAEPPHAQPAAPEPACGAWTARDITVEPGYQCSVAASAPGLSLAVFFEGNASAR